MKRKLFVAVGWLFIIAGGLLQVFSMLGWFANVPWTKFSGFTAFIIGVVIRWASGFRSLDELEDGLREKFDEISKQEKEAAFRLQSGYSPIQTLFLVLIFGVVVVLIILFLQAN